MFLVIQYPWPFLPLTEYSAIDLFSCNSHILRFLCCICAAYNALLWRCPVNVVRVCIILHVLDDNDNTNDNGFQCTLVNVTYRPGTKSRIPPLVYPLFTLSICSQSILLSICYFSQLIVLSRELSIVFKFKEVVLPSCPRWSIIHYTPVSGNCSHFTINSTDKIYAIYMIFFNPPVPFFPS